MKFRTLSCIVLAAGLFNNVLAARVSQRWGDMHVQISNQTGTSCVASEPARNVHGTYDAYRLHQLKSMIQKHLI